MLTEETKRIINLPFKNIKSLKGPAVGYRVRKPRDKRDLLVGMLLKERYYVLSVLGKGGMSLVYKAKDLTNNKIVAVKALRTQGLGDETIVKRFKQEAEVLHRLNHPRIVSVYDYGTSRIGQPYFVMDYLVGVSLSQVLRKQRHLPLERFQDIFVQVAAAVSHAHKHKAIHRDLKPGNIMLVRMNHTNDYVKIVDFGIAKLAEEASKLTRLGEVWGSPIYMSPEQGMGTKIDTRTDIYSLGVVMYEALTGEVPFLGKNYVETMTKQMTEAPAPFSEVAPGIEIPASLEMIVFKALQKSPDDRYQTMAELKAELEKALSPKHIEESISPIPIQNSDPGEIWSFIRNKIHTESETPDSGTITKSPNELKTKNRSAKPAKKHGETHEDFITTQNRPQVVAASLPQNLLTPSEFVQRQSQKLKPLAPTKIEFSQEAPLPTVNAIAERKPLNSLVQKQPVEDNLQSIRQVPKTILEDTLPPDPVNSIQTKRKKTRETEITSELSDSRIRKRPKSAKRRTLSSISKIDQLQSGKGGKKASIKPLVTTCLILLAIAIGAGILMSPQARTFIFNLIYEPEKLENQSPYNQNGSYPQNPANNRKPGPESNPFLENYQ